jgi:hypothetical protein
MKRVALPITLVVLVPLAGCMSGIEERSASTTTLGLSVGGAPSEPSTEAPPCVMEVPGTGIRMLDIEGGVAVVFDTVTPASVGVLRRAVRALRESYADERVAHADGHSHSPRAHELARQFRSVNGDLPAHTTEVTDVSRGARLEVRAADVAQTALLRTKMRAEIATMQRGVCPLVY